MGCAKTSGEGRGGSQADGVVLLAGIGEMRRRPRDSGDQIRRPQGTKWRERRGEMERETRASYRNQRLRNWCCQTPELKRRTPSVSGEIPVQEVEDNLSP